MGLGQISHGRKDRMVVPSKGMLREGILVAPNQDFQGAAEAAERQRSGSDHLVSRPGAAAGGPPLHHRHRHVGGRLHSCGAIAAAAPLPRGREKAPWQRFSGRPTRQVANSRPFQLDLLGAQPHFQSG